MRMAATQYEFTCPDKHPFKAIAKLRARCPQCGKMSRRQFTPVIAPSEPSLEGTSTTLPDSSRKVVTKKGTASGSKPDTTSTKAKESESESVSSPVSPPSTPKLATIVKQGLPRVAAKPKTPAKPPVKTKPVVTRGPVKHVTAKTGHTPTVTKPPVGSKERKVIEQTTDEPFWHKVKRKYFV